jgi:hypothetical protein
MLVRPEETLPQISVRHPRGSPPVSASSSRTPHETVSGSGDTSSEAGPTPATRTGCGRSLGLGWLFEEKDSQGTAEASADDMTTSRVYAMLRGEERKLLLSLFIRLCKMRLRGVFCQGIPTIFLCLCYL